MLYFSVLQRNRAVELVFGQADEFATAVGLDADEVGLVVEELVEDVVVDRNGLGRGHIGDGEEALDGVEGDFFGKCI